MRSACCVLLLVMALGCEERKAPPKSDEPVAIPAPVAPKVVSTFGDEPLLIRGKVVHCANERVINRTARFCDVAAEDGKVRYEACETVSAFEIPYLPDSVLYTRARYLRCASEKAGFFFVYYADEPGVPDAAGELLGMAKVLTADNVPFDAARAKFESIYGRTRSVSGFLGEPARVQLRDDASTVDGEAWLGHTFESGEKAGARGPLFMALVNLDTVHAFEIAAKAATQAAKANALNSIK